MPPIESTAATPPPKPAREPEQPRVIETPRENRGVLDTPLRQAAFFGGLVLVVIAGLALSYFGRHWL